MKISVLQQDLLPALSAAARSVGVRAALPVLGNVLLSVEDQKLKIAATNLEIGVIKFIPVKVDGTGDITVPAKTLLDIISGLGPTSVELESVGNNLTIRSAKFKATINGIPSSEFPVIPLPEGDGISLPKEVISEIHSIVFASAADEGRPILTGILTEVSAGFLNLVATDGFRLAHKQVKLSDERQEFKSLIPRRTFEEVARIILEDEADNIEIRSSKDKNQIIFKVGQTIVSSRLIEGQFPSWQKIIPTNTTTRVIVDRGVFLQATKLASVFARNEANIVTCKIMKDGLTLSSEAKELGSQENEVEATIEGDELSIAFNAKFLLEAISNAPGTQLIIEFSGPLSPALIKPVGMEGLEYIVMPVRIGS
jgi:DNA polymerase III subunit beta